MMSLQKGKTPRDRTIAYVVFFLLCTVFIMPHSPRAEAWNGPGGPTKDVAHLEAYIPNVRYHSSGHA